VDIGAGGRDALRRGTLRRMGVSSLDREEPGGLQPCPNRTPAVVAPQRVPPNAGSGESVRQVGRLAAMDVEEWHYRHGRRWRLRWHREGRPRWQDPAGCQREGGEQQNRADPQQSGGDGGSDHAARLSTMRRWRGL
jgi:hypothetical protein